MKDVSELLREAVPAPQREVDVGVVAGLARRRWRRRRFVAATAVASLVAFVAGLVLVDGSGEPRIEVAGTPRAANADAGVSVDLPPGWQELPLVARTAPVELLVVGTAARPTGEPISACFPGDGLPTSRSAYVTLYEYQPGDGLASPSGDGASGQYTIEAFRPRPVPFTTAQNMLNGNCVSPLVDVPSTSEARTSAFAQTSPTTSTPDPSSPEATGPPSATSDTSTPTTAAKPAPENHFREIPFTEDGRLFLARIVSVDDPTEELLTQGFQVLDSLIIEPRDVTPPLVPTTTADAPPDEAATKQSIIDAINAANGTPSPVPLALSVEGGHPFVNPEDANAAAENAANADDTTRRAYEASQEGKIVARINWIEFDSPTRAQLNFDLLVDGQQITATTTGYAVFEEGNWRLGRDTFCEIFARGGLQCPA